MLQQSQDKRLLAKQPVLKLVGRYFHSMEKGADGRRNVVSWQGQVMSQINDEVYLVEIFEWLSGYNSCSKLVTLEQMLHWQFYDDAEQMNNWYEYSYRPPESKPKSKRHPQIS